MSTIIDELIVTLNLDPRGFNQAQRQSIQQLRGFQQQANTTANQIQAGAGNRLVRFWQSLNKPIGQAQVNLNQLGAQSNRIGTQIAAGINQGTVSLSRLTTTALAAYGAVKTVQGAVKTLNDAISGGAETGRRAGYAGTSAGFMSRLAIGANIRENVSKDQTEQTLVGFRQMAESARQGKLDENRARFLSQLGVLNLALRNDIDPEEQQREMLRQIGERFKGMGLPQAVNIGREIGLDPGFTTALRKHGERGLESAGAPYAITERQAEQFRKLQEAINTFTASWDALINKMIEDHPNLVVGVKSLSDFINDLKKSPEQLKAVETGLDIIVALIGVSLVSALAKATLAINSFWATPLLKFLATRAGPLAFLSTMFGNTGNIPANEHALPGADPRVEENFRRNARPGPRVPVDDRTWWQKVAPRGWGGKDRTDIGKTVPIPGSSSSSSPITDGTAADLLGPLAVGNAVVGGPSGVEGVLPEYAQRIKRMHDAMPENIRNKFKIISGHRDEARQAQINPGVTNSHHTSVGPGTAIAVDTTTDPEVLKWINENGGRFGVGYTLKNLPNEENHLEMLGPNGQRIPASKMGEVVRPQAAVSKSQDAPPHDGRSSELTRISELNKKEKLSISEMRELAIYAGFNDAQGPLAAAIAMGESSGVASKHNTEGKDDSYGLTQINARAHGPRAKEALIPFAAFRLMHQISKEGKDFSPWTVYNSGKYKEFLNTTAPSSNISTDVANGLSSVRGTNASKNGTSSPTTTNNHDISVGDVHVHTPATDAAGIARDMRGEINRTLDVTTSNTGLDY